MQQCTFLSISTHDHHNSKLALSAKNVITFGEDFPISKKLREAIYTEEGKDIDY